MSQMESKLKLQAEVFSKEQSLGSFVTEGNDRLIIGSSKKADLVVPHKSVSQIHAMLRVLPDEQILLYDLGSEAGTYVGGQKIIERRLKPGDFFEIGEHKVKVDILLGKGGNLTDERALFWKTNALPSVTLEVFSFSGGILQEEFNLQPGKALVFGKKGIRLQSANDTFVSRKSGDTTECTLPKSYVAEIYSLDNKLLRTIEQAEGKFTFNTKEKARLRTADENAEIFLFWREQGQRGNRSMKDADADALKKALGGCLALAALILLVMNIKPADPEALEEALTPKSSYFRMSMDSAPAPASESQQPAQGENEKSAQQPSKAASISSSLSKLINKKSSLSAETIQQAISANGKQSVRSANINNSNIKSSEIATGSIGGGAVNVNALSAGLASGSGTNAGSLKGFAGGKGGGVGTGIGGSGFGGKGFDMSLGGDEAEAIGGLDKNLIAAVVQSNIGQIKHCYERQLIVDPNIFGKIVAQWTITKDGTVSTTSVKKSTMGNQPVENCILGKIKNWNFPKPKGGGQVIVSYPFLFKSLN